MPKYEVSVTRTTIYKAEADTAEDAITAMMNGEAAEVDENTSDMSARAVCPVCDEELTDQTTREVRLEGEIDLEPSYCPRCCRDTSSEVNP